MVGWFRRVGLPPLRWSWSVSVGLRFSFPLPFQGLPVPGQVCWCWCFISPSFFCVPPLRVLVKQFSSHFHLLSSSFSSHRPDLNRCKTSTCRGTWHTIRDHVQRSSLIVWIQSLISSAYRLFQNLFLSWDVANPRTTLPTSTIWVFVSARLP